MNLKPNNCDLSIIQANNEIKNVDRLIKKQSAERPRFKISDFGKLKNASVSPKDYVPIWTEKKCLKKLKTFLSGVNLTFQKWFESFTDKDSL